METTTYLIDSLILPPGGPILLAFLGLILWKLGFGRRLFVLALVLLWVCSLPITEKLLFAGLERYPALDEASLAEKKPEAIVLLGTAPYLNAPEYGGDTAGQRMLTRLRYAAKLARELNLPVIPSGGTSERAHESEARIYAKILQEEFAVRVEQIESRSRSTWENARYTAQILKKEGIDNVILVTDAAHMPRAVYAFEKNGIKPIPAPTWFVSQPDQPWVVTQLLPGAYAMYNVTYALHEYLGLLRYRWY